MYLFSSLCPTEVTLGSQTGKLYDETSMTTSPHNVPKCPWPPVLFKLFQMVFKTRCSRAASVWPIPLHMGGISNLENHSSQPLNSNLGLKCQTSKNKGKRGILSLSLAWYYEPWARLPRSAQDQWGLFHNLTSHRCPESAPPLPVCELSGLEVLEAMKKWRRSGPGGVGRGGSRRKNLGALVAINVRRMRQKPSTLS